MLVSEVIDRAEQVSPQLAYFRRHQNDPEFRRRKNERQAKHQAEVRHFLSLYKMLWGCVDCGFDQDAAALDFDHVGGSKSFALSQGGSRSWNRIWNELAKCVIRCANCHRIKTYGGSYVGV